MRNLYTAVKMTKLYFFDIFLISLLLHITTTVTNSDYSFLGLRNTTILTPSGNLTSQGRASQLTNGSRTVLSLQGNSSVTFPRERCLENLDTCQTGFTVSLTFRISVAASEPTPRVYILDSGSDRGNFTGVTLFLEGFRITCVLAGTTRVWWLEIQQGLRPDVWHQLQVSWHPVLGLTLWAGLHVLGSSVEGQPQQPGSVRSHGPLRFGSVDNVDSSYLQLSGLSVMEAFITDILMGGLAGFSTTTNFPTSTHTSTRLTTTETKGEPSTSPPPAISFQMIVVNFLMASGQQLLTTRGTMATHGDVTLEPVPSGLVLVLDTDGEYVEMGTPLLCFRDVTSCYDGFNLRISFELLRNSPGHNILLSSGGDQLDMSGVTLSYFNYEMVFIVKTNTSTWMGLYNVTIQPGFWYTVDASWDGHRRGTLHLNNLELPSRVYNIPHPPPAQRGHPLLLATGPGRQGSTLMKVYEVDFWATDRAHVRRQELDLPVLPSDPESTFTWAAVPEPTEPTSGEDDPVLTQPANNERLEGMGAQGEVNRVAIIALGTLCALLTLSVVVGAAVFCRSRRRKAKQARSMHDRSLITAPSENYSFGGTRMPRAFHDNSFTSLSAAEMTLY